MKKEISNNEADLYPPDERKKNIGRFTPKERVIIILKDLGCTYPAEIIAKTGIHRSTLFDTLSIMREEGTIKLIKVSKNSDEWPKEFKNRIKEFWAKGKKGGKLQQLSIYVLAKDQLKTRGRVPLD